MGLRTTFPVLAVLTALCTGPAVADTDPAKFAVDGDTLTYDSETPGPGETSGIALEDVAIMLDLLRGNEAITRLQLNSSGGELYAASQMSDIVLDFGLDTHIHGDCDSSCVLVFLAGAHRTMSRGSRIGFHQVYWPAENIAGYYEKERESRGWQSPFDFASWMYRDTQDEVYAHLKYLTSRGVDPMFAIESIRNPQSEMWRPHRSELQAAGVLTE